MEDNLYRLLMEAFLRANHLSRDLKEMKESQVAIWGDCYL